MATNVDQLAGRRIGLGLERFAYGLVATAHGGDRQHRQNGVEQPPCHSAAHLRRTLTIIQTTSANRTGGHTQPSTVCTAADPLKEPRPTSAINAAGAAAHRWGWSLNRVDSTSSNAQPSANPSSTTLVKAFSLTGRTGAAMRTAATISQAAMDRATIDPILVLAVGCAPGCWRSPCRVPVAMIASTEQRARGDENPSPLYTKSSVPRQYVAQKAKSLAREPGPSNRTLIGGRDSDSVQHVAAIALIPVPRNTLRSTPLRLSHCGIIWTDIWAAMRENSSGVWRSRSGHVRGCRYY